MTSELLNAVDELIRFVQQFGTISYNNGLGVETFELGRNNHWTIPEAERAAFIKLDQRLYALLLESGLDHVLPSRESTAAEWTNRDESCPVQWLGRCNLPFDQAGDVLLIYPHCRWFEDMAALKAVVERQARSKKPLGRCKNQQRLALSDDGQDALDLLRETPEVPTSVSTETPGGTATTESRQPDPEFIFRSNGDGYLIQAFGESGHFVLLKGLNDIFRLIFSPTGEISMRELCEWSANVSCRSSQESSRELVDAGHSKELKPDNALDGEYMRDLKLQMQDLIDELKTATDECDRRRIQCELDKVHDQLLKNTNAKRLTKNWIWVV